LKQRRATLDLHVRLDHHSRNERWLRQPRGQLNGSLDNAGLGRRRRNVAQADKKNDSEMKHEERREEPPRDRELQPSELEEHQPYDETVGEQQDESEQHGGSV
jgi:hypothetical protein